MSFHHISSDEVYRMLEADGPAFLEIAQYAPNSAYSVSMGGTGDLVWAGLLTLELPVNANDCSIIHSTYQHGEKYIPTVIRSYGEGNSIPVHGDGENIRDCSYVRDHCSGIDAVICKGGLGECYNIDGINGWMKINICYRFFQLMDDEFLKMASVKS